MKAESPPETPKDSGPRVLPIPPPAPGLRSLLVASVPAGTFGPYLGVSGDRRLLVWAQPTGTEQQQNARRPGEGEAHLERDWCATTLPTTPSALDDSLDAVFDTTAPSGALCGARAPADIVLATVKPAKPTGYVIVSVAHEPDGYRVDVLGVGDEGKVSSTPKPIGKTPREVLWVDAVTTAQRSVVLWAERDGAKANVYAVTLTDVFEPSEAPRLIATGVQAWQAQGFESGVVLAIVASAPESATAGAVQVVFLDQAGRLERQALVSSGATAGRDIDAIVSESRVWLAWSDERQLETRVYTAVVGLDGVLIHEPRPAARALAPQAFVRLVAPASANELPYLVWEEPLRGLAGGENARKFLIARLSANGIVSTPPVELTFANKQGALPEVAASAGGLVALTSAPPCEADPLGAEPSKPCAAPPRPMFVEFDSELRVTNSAPVRLSGADGVFADLAWGLSCASTGCTTIAARSLDPAPVYQVELRPDDEAWRPPARVSAARTAPFAESVESLLEADSLTGIDLEKVGTHHLLAWLTYFDPQIPYVVPKQPALDGRLAPLRARLEVALLDPAGQIARREIVSYRAHSPGGLDLATHPASGQTLLVWTALDALQPQVFATLLDASGHKVQQRMVTTKSGDVTDVAVAAVDDGFVVAWVDERRGYPAVWSTKLDMKLERRSAERSIAAVPGSASDLVAFREGDRVWLARADARGTTPGRADIYLTPVAATDANVAGEEWHFESREAHAHSPVLAQSAHGLVLGWVHEKPEHPAEQVVELRLLDGKGSTAGETTFEVVGNTAALALECFQDLCRGVLVAGGPAHPWLRAFSWALDESDTTDQALLPLLSAQQNVVTPRFFGKLSIFADVLEGRGRVRRADLAWP